MGKNETEEAGVERWLHEQVGPAYDALKADPGCAVTANQVRARLADIAQAIELARCVDVGLEPLSPFDPAECLDSTEVIAFFLEEAEATGDPGFIAHAREIAARARAMHGIE